MVSLIMKIVNQKAKFDYELGERIEAGIVLNGAEAKSAYGGAVDMTHSYAKIMPSKFKGQREAWVINLHIYPYSHANNDKYDPKRTRKLLLHQKELLSLETKMRTARLQLVPTAMYTSSGKIKVELALSRGKRVFEKRESIKKRDLDREMERGNK